MPDIPDLPMSGEHTKALEFAADLARQILTVATGILAFTVTFAEKFDIDPATPLAVPDSMRIAWVCFVLAVIAAIWLLMAIAGSANAVRTGDTAAGDIMNTNTAVPASIMCLTFIAAVSATVFAGWSLTG